MDLVPSTVTTPPYNTNALIDFYCHSLHLMKPLLNAIIHVIGSTAAAMISSVIYDGWFSTIISESLFKHQPYECETADEFP